MPKTAAAESAELTACKQLIDEHPKLRHMNDQK
jgi:hypothetical protein